MIKDKANENNANAAHVVDEFSGMGGSYSLDPNTGRRTLITRTKSLAEADAEAKVADAAAAAEPPADKASEPLAAQLIAAVAAELAEPATPQRKK